MCIITIYFAQIYIFDSKVAVFAIKYTASITITSFLTFKCISFVLRGRRTNLCSICSQHLCRMCILCMTKIGIIISAYMIIPIFAFCTCIERIYTTSSSFRHKPKIGLNRHANSRHFHRFELVLWNNAMNAMPLMPFRNRCHRRATTRSLLSHFAPSLILSPPFYI